MTYSLRITQEASEQLVSLQRYISAQATPEIAENYIAEILAHCEGLTVFPRRGPARAADQRRVCVANAGLREAAGMASAARSHLRRAAQRRTLFCTGRCDMKTMSYTESRARYAEVLDGVINDREEVVITRAGHDPVVIVSLEDYESLKETAYLMRSPANARRLLDAMERLEAGRGEAHDLLETE